MSITQPGQSPLSWGTWNWSLGDFWVTPSVILLKRSLHWPQPGGSGWASVLTSTSPHPSPTPGQSLSPQGPGAPHPQVLVCMLRFTSTLKLPSSPWPPGWASKGASKSRCWPLPFQAAFPDLPGWVSPPTLWSHGPPRGHHHSAHTKRQCVCCSGSLTNRGVSQELDLVGGIPGSPTGTQSRLTRGKNQWVNGWARRWTKVLSPLSWLVPTPHSSRALVSGWCSPPRHTVLSPTCQGRPTPIPPAWGGFVSLKIQIFLWGRDLAGLIMLASTHSPSLGPQAGAGHSGCPGWCGEALGTEGPGLQPAWPLPSCRTLDRALLSQPLFPLLQNEGEAAPLSFTGASSPFSQPRAHGRRPTGPKVENKTATVYWGCPGTARGWSHLFLSIAGHEGGPSIIPILQMGSKAEWSWVTCPQSRTECVTPPGPSPGLHCVARGTEDRTWEVPRHPVLSSHLSRGHPLLPSHQSEVTSSVQAPPPPASPGITSPWSSLRETVQLQTSSHCFPTAWNPAKALGGKAPSVFLHPWPLRTPPWAEAPRCSLHSAHSTLVARLFGECL